MCMWCWHRIRESESGLCPACRTPYGDDPHEFSAVDVEEVLKANKEKEAAAKRERDRQRHLNDGNSSDGEGIAALTGGNLRGQMEVPKDRTQLANMRVIRRNLVYAVGLPPTIASEDTLRKAEYFGQYGKISKIVLNRSQAVGSDTRRASASAYVTFLHKVRFCIVFASFRPVLSRPCPCFRLIPHTDASHYMHTLSIRRIRWLVSLLWTVSI